MSNPAPPPSQSEPQPINPASLPLPALRQLSTQINTDLSTLTNSFSQLRAAQSKFRSSISAIKSGLQPTDTANTTPPTIAARDREILVPLTTSLYVQGRLSDPEKVLVDVGTGYFIEKTNDDAIRFYEGKVEQLGKSLTELEKIIQTKSQNARIIEEALRQKVLSESQAVQASASS